MKTQILFILDRSGSMSSCASDAVGGFNDWLAEQRKEPKGKRLTLLQFDDKRELTYDKAKIKDCAYLELGKTYQPRGMTALLDAIGSGINSIRDAEKAIVAIYTDGYENASREYSAEKVKALIKEVTAKGWEVLFMASDIDTTYATQALGMAAHTVAAVQGQHVGASMRAFSARTSNYASSGVASDDSLQSDYEKEKTAR